MTSAFGSLVEQLIESLTVVFPECVETQEALLLFRNTIDDARIEELMDMWHQQVGSVHADDIRARRPDPLLDAMEQHALLRRLGMRSKWVDPGFVDEHKEVMWEYIDGLTNIAAMRSQIPRGMLGRIEAIASSLADDINGGSMSNLNLAEVGQRVLDGVDESEIQEFTGNIGGICDMLRGGGAGGAQQPDMQGIMALASMMGGAQR